MRKSKPRKVRALLEGELAQMKELFSQTKLTPAQKRKLFTMLEGVELAGQIAREFLRVFR